MEVLGVEEGVEVSETLGFVLSFLFLLAVGGS
jgi:hypothetical protein